MPLYKAHFLLDQSLGVLVILIILRLFIFVLYSFKIAKVLSQDLSLTIIIS